MLAIEYILGFSMIYLFIFRILNFEQKRQIWRLNLVIFVLLACIDGISKIRYGYQPAGIFGGYVTASLVLLIALYALEGFKSWRAWLSILVAFFISMLLTHITFVFIFSLLGHQLELMYEMLNENAIYSTIGTFSGTILLFTLHRLAKLLNLKINVYALSKAEVVFILLFLTVFGVFVTTIFELSVQHENVLASSIVNFLALLAGIVGIYFVVYLATQRSTIYEIQNREKQQELIFAEQRQNYERMKARNEEISIFKHNINDELLYLSDLMHDSELERANTYLTKMRGKLEVIEQAVGQDTGSRAVNASWYALTNSKQYAEIVATWLGRLPTEITIDDRDLVLLFSNLLNNAFEAAYQAVDKYVTVKVDVKDSGLFVSVRNSYQGEIVEKLDGDFETTKEDRENHGIGVRIIKNIVEKYCGKVKFNYSDGEFAVVIVFGGGVFTTR